MTKVCPIIPLRSGACMLCLLLLMVAPMMHARTVQATDSLRLSWDWWPTGIQAARTPNVAYTDSLHIVLGASATAASGEYAPFWLYTNTSTIHAYTPYSGSIMVGLSKGAEASSRWFDYAFQLTATARTYSRLTDLTPMRTPLSLTYGQGDLSLPIAWAYARLFVFDVSAGLQPLMPLTADSILSMGSLLLSSNAAPLPLVSIGISRYTPFLGCYGYLHIKGGITQAWLTDNIWTPHAMLHYKYLGLRVGERLPLSLTYEVHHAAQWGGWHPVYGDLGNGLHALRNVLLARAGGSMANDQLNAQGNHIVSQQLMLTAKGRGWQADLYWQNVSEDNLIFLGFGQNIADGLWGVNVHFSNWQWVQSVVYEFLNTTDQSGPWHDRDGLCYAGKDNYYRNGVYAQGWASYMRTMGNAFLSSPMYNTNGSLSTTNTRVRVHHWGIRGDIYGYMYALRASWVRNYGNDNSRVSYQSTNTALCLEVRKTIAQAGGCTFGAMLGADIGSQFGNSIAARISVSKTFGLSLQPSPQHSRSREIHP